MIAIITPYYTKLDDKGFSKRKEYLDETIRSVKSQITPLLHVIVDDGSELNVAEEIAREHDPRNLVIIKRQRGTKDKLTCTNALNFGLECTLNNRLPTVDTKQIEYFTFLHSDDLVVNLNSRVKEMQDNNLGFIYTDAIIFKDPDVEGILWEGVNGSIDSVRSTFWTEGRMPYPTMT